MMKNGIIAGFVIIVFILFGTYLDFRYNQYSLVWQLNPKINVDGIQLMMAENDVKNLIGKDGQQVQGFGGYKLVYENKGISLNLLDDRDTDFYNKVSEINITSADYEILGLKVGEKYEEALSDIYANGFIEEREGYPGFWRTNMYIILDKNDSNEIKNITIGIKDKASESRVY